MPASTIPTAIETAADRLDAVHTPNDAATRGRAIAGSLLTLGGDAPTFHMIASDVRDLLDGSAIECVYTLDGHRVEVSIDNRTDELIVQVDGREIHRSPAP